MRHSSTTSRHGRGAALISLALIAIAAIWYFALSRRGAREEDGRGAGRG